ncbi:hypothetical protein N665_0445s0037 [Sinapis alba]|nr:hypothetical protein N665_0445s0037 [Sinapis alba]
MVRVSVLLCFVLLVVIMVSVSFAENNEVKSTDLKKVKGQETDQSITKVNDDGEHDDDHDHDHDHDNDNDDDHDNNHGHDHDNDDDDDHDNNDDQDNDYDNDDDDDDDKDDHDNDNEDDDDDDNNDDDNEEDEKETLRVYELKKGSLTVKFTNRGASIISLLFPDENGKMEDVVLGYDSVNEYMNDTVFFGATVGRVANRREKTVANDAKNTIHHGGKKGFGHAIWKVMKHKYTGKKPYIVFTYTSPDGDQGFPGKLDVTATYTLVGENQLKLVMEAKAREKATPVNLVHHSYWNLGGHNNGDILLSEEIQILGSGYAHVDDNLIPTGKILSVKGTSYDFLKLRPIKHNINEIKLRQGINYCLDGVANQMRKVVVLVDKKSKRKMELYTDQSGLKLYSGGSLKTMKGKNGSVYKAYSGLCLETQSFSTAINSQIVQPGDKYKHTLLFKFSILP